MVNCLWLFVNLTFWTVWTMFLWNKQWSTQFCASEHTQQLEIFVVMHQHSSNTKTSSTFLTHTVIVQQQACQLLVDLQFFCCMIYWEKSQNTCFRCVLLWMLNNFLCGNVKSRKLGAPRFVPPASCQQDTRVFSVKQKYHMQRQLDDVSQKCDLLYGRIATEKAVHRKHQHELARLQKQTFSGKEPVRMKQVNMWQQQNIRELMDKTSLKIQNTQKEYDECHSMFLILSKQISPAVSEQQKNVTKNVTKTTRELSSQLEKSEQVQKQRRVSEERDTCASQQNKGKEKRDKICEQNSLHMREWRAQDKLFSSGEKEKNQKRMKKMWVEDTVFASAEKEKDWACKASKGPKNQVWTRKPNWHVKQKNKQKTLCTQVQKRTRIVSISSYIDKLIQSFAAQKGSKIQRRKNTSVKLTVKNVQLR